MDEGKGNTGLIIKDQDDDGIIEASFGGKTIVIDRRDASLIINNECKRIMRNLCGSQAPVSGSFDSGRTEVTQPCFLSQEDRVLFFKTKMFYLLQERHCFLQQSLKHTSRAGSKSARKTMPAEAYPTFLSPFCEESSDYALAGRRRRERTSELYKTVLDGTKIVMSALHEPQKFRSKTSSLSKKSGMGRFVDNLRKADLSVLHILEEKVLKTMEGAGYSSLFSDIKETKRFDVTTSLFPDYNLLVDDGKDEESKLNNLVNHVRTRIKYADKLQSFYENPPREDHTALEFTAANIDAVEMREELVNLKPKQMHQLDNKKLQKLFATFKDDYSTAKTTLIADGTQPVVLNRKKLDRVKKYVDECVDWKGSMLVPYVRETNFFFLTIPWSRMPEAPIKHSASDVTQST